MLYLAKAYYESKNYPKCISTLSRAIHLRPNDMRLWYNIGLAQEDYAVTTLGQESAPQGSRNQAATPQRTMADVQRAIMDLKRAQRIFRFLLQHAETASQTKKSGSSSLPFDKEKVSEHEKFIGDTLTKASYHLEFERQREEKRRLENEAQRKMLLEYEERLAREKEADRQREEDMKKRREDVLSKQEERLKQLSEGWRVREREEEEKKVVKKRGGGGKKRKKGEEDDEGAFIDNGSAEEDEDGDVSMSIEDMKNRNAKMKHLVDKRKKRARVDSSDDEKDDDATGLFGSDSSDDEQEAAGAASPKPAAASPPAKAEANEILEAEKNELFGSSSDED